MFIAYATSPGKVAADGRGKHSPFTSGLLKYIKTPDLEVGPMFARVRRHVFRATGKVQRTWDTSGLIDPFYMNRHTPAGNKRVATFYRPEPESRREEIYTKPLLQQPEENRLQSVRTRVRDKAKKSGKVIKKTRRKNRTRKNTAKKSRPKARVRKRATKKTRSKARSRKKAVKKSRPKARTKKKVTRKAKPRVRVRKKVAKKSKPKVRAKKRVVRKTKPKAKPKRRVAKKKTVRKRRTARARPAPRRNTGGSPTSNGFVGF